jgi:hypothetical protein
MLLGDIECYVKYDFDVQIKNRGLSNMPYNITDYIIDDIMLPKFDATYEWKACAVIVKKPQYNPITFKTLLWKVSSSKTIYEAIDVNDTESEIIVKNGGGYKYKFIGRFSQPLLESLGHGLALTNVQWNFYYNDIKEIK